MGAIVILGASGGIGSALGELLVARGHSLCLAGRSEVDLQALADRLPESVVSVGDLTEPAAVKQVFETATQRFGQIDGVVNCLGSILLKPAHLTSEDEFLDTIRTNLFSAFLCVKYAVPRLQSGGRIVLVSSCAARIGLANHEAIAAAKAGVEGLVRSAAATYAPKGIAINCVAPGLVQTKLSKKITENQRAGEYSKSLHPLGRFGEARDIAQAIAFLLDSENSWITGTVLAVDGGLAQVKG